MQNLHAHHGLSSRSITETETHRALKLSSDGTVEEWIGFVHRQIDMVLSGRTLFIRTRTYVRITMRRLLRRVFSEDDVARAEPERADIGTRFLRDAFAPRPVMFDRTPVLA